MRDQPWHELPAEVVTVLRPALDDVAGEIIQAVATVPAYARPLDGPFGEGLRIGVQGALRHFSPRSRPGARSSARTSTGRSERGRCARDAVLNRSSARTGSAPASPGGASPPWGWSQGSTRRRSIRSPSRSSPTSTCSRPSRLRVMRRRGRRWPARPSCAAVGWCACSSASPGRSRGGRERRDRRRLAAAPDLAAMAIAGDDREAVPAGLPKPAISESIGDIVCALVADPDGPGRRTAIEQAVAGARARAGLGTTVDWAQARISLLRAEAAVDLAGRDGALIAARDRAGDLLLRSDRPLAAELAADRLAPLAGLTPAVTPPTARDPARLARRAGPTRRRGPPPGHPPADGPLSPGSPAGAVRSGARGPGRALLAGGGVAGA